eukprot:13447071-Alexandrium_andersonii.AAC.1
MGVRWQGSSNTAPIPGSVHAKVHTVPSAIRSRCRSAAIHHDLQSALPNMQHCLRLSELEPHGPEPASHFVPQAPEGCLLAA